MAKYEKYESQGIGNSRAAIKNRMKVLEDMITICLANMNMAKEDNQYVSER